MISPSVGLPDKFWRPGFFLRCAYYFVFHFTLSAEKDIIGDRPQDEAKADIDVEEAGNTCNYITDGPNQRAF